MNRDPMDRIAAALERMSPPPLKTPDFDVAGAFGTLVAHAQLGKSGF